MKAAVRKTDGRFLLNGMICIFLLAKGILLIRRFTIKDSAYLQREKVRRSWIGRRKSHSGWTGSRPYDFDR